MITKELVTALLEMEEKFASDNTMEGHALRHKQSRDDEPFIAVACDNLRILCQSWLEQQEELDQLRGCSRGRKACDYEIDQFKIKLPEWENKYLQIKRELTQTQDALEKTCEAFEWIMARVHQGNHDGPIEICGKATCIEYRTALTNHTVQAARRKK